MAVLEDAGSFARQLEELTQGPRRDGASMRSMS